MAAYIGIIHKDQDSDFGVSFPDFPGCTTAATTMNEAAAMAREALGGHIALMDEDGEPIPAPSTLEAVQAHEFAEGAVAFIVVDAPVPARRAVKVSITVPEDDLAEIDRYAKEHGMARSAFLVQAAREAMRG
jgi:predicted RNase H-like HicB family nuclease